MPCAITVQFRTKIIDTDQQDVWFFTGTTSAFPPVLHPARNRKRMLDKMMLFLITGFIDELIGWKTQGVIGDFSPLFYFPCQFMYGLLIFFLVIKIFHLQGILIEIEKL